MPIQTDRFPILLSDFGGLKTDRNSDDLPIGKSPNLLNVRIRGSHFIGALGYELVGERNSATGEISSQYTYNRNDGDKVMVRVKDDGTNGTLEWYDETNKKWYTLLGSLTTGKIMGFAEFNSSTLNRMIFCNGVENISLWTGAITRLTAAVALHATSIPVASTTDFPATGTIIYNGTEIAYTSKTATAFAVADAHASAGADDGVAEAADDSTNSGVDKGNILLSAFDRLWIAGQPGSPTELVYSDEGAPFTFTGGSNRTDSGSEDILNIGGKITGLSSKDDNIVVLGRDGGVGLKFVYPTSTTKAPVYTNLFFAPGQGCLSHQSIVNLNNEVYFANRDGFVAISDLIGTEKTFLKTVTEDILPTLHNYVFDEAAAIYDPHEDILLLACKSDSDFPGNDIVIALDFYRTKEGLRTFGITKLDWPVNCFNKLNDDIYFGSSLEMNSFKGFSTYQNDGSPRTIKYVTRRINGGNPFQEKGSQLVAVKGFIKDGSEIDVEILYEGGFKGTVNKTILSDGDYVSKVTLNSLGAFALGTNPMGENIEEVSDLKQFRVYLDVGVDYRWSDIQISFTSETDGGNFSVDHVGIAAKEEGVAAPSNLIL